jgi:putative oxidoreductase
MNVRKFLFPSVHDDKRLSVVLLVFRLVFGLLLASHGVQKLMAFSQMSGVFPDPLGLGSQLSLSLAIFGELFCSIAFIFGFLYRLSMIPMIFTMWVAFFIIHAGMPFQDKELAYVYLLVFLILYISGPGRYALDTYIGRKIGKKKE